MIPDDPDAAADLLKYGRSVVENFEDSELNFEKESALALFDRYTERLETFQQVLIARSRTPDFQVE